MSRPSATTRTLLVLEALAGYAQRGARNSDLAAATGLTRVHVCRACDALIAHGWARQNQQTSRYYPTPAFARISYVIDREFDRARRELDDRYQAMRGHP